MKKTIMVLSILLLSAVTSHGVETITWCAYFNWSPWIYPVENGYDGILIEELKQFEKDHQVKADVVVINNWKRCQKQLENGKIDMILGANKTEEREKLFNYIDEPAFINRSTISAYALKDNKSVTAVKNLDGLKRYKLQVTRGNSFGNKVDDFVKSIPEKQKETVNNHETLLKKILRKRGDYFFSADSSFEPLIKKYQEQIPELDMNLFHKIYTTQREIPVYIIFSKKGEVFDKYGPLWVETLKNYFSKNDIDERIQYHNENSNKKGASN